MIFEALAEAAQRGELLLVEGGMCRYHLRRDGQLTIHEIISTRPGAGSRMLEALRGVAGARLLVARCPADLAANQWYKRRGFALVAIGATRRGRPINTWAYRL